MSVKGLVSTIIPVHNRPELLIQSVESVVAQDYRPVEIIIVDDASSDSTWDTIDSLEVWHPPLVCHIRLDTNSGPGVAREAGRQKARGEFIQYLDSDDVLLAGKFTAQVTALERDLDAGIAYGKTRYVEGDGTVLAPWKGTGQVHKQLFPSFLNDRWWGTSTPLYRASVCDRVGPWSQLRQLEDWEYDCRFAAIRTPLAYVDSFVSEEHGHAGPRLSSLWLEDPEMMRDRARAYMSVFESARKSGIGTGTPEVQRFSRTLFLTARQCGAVGLRSEARLLFQLARQASGSDSPGQLDLRAYGVLARMFGWSTMGKLSARLERFRA